MIVRVAAAGRVPAEVLSVADRPCNVRGGMLLSHVGWVEEQHGAGGVAELQRRLPADFPRLTDIRREDWIVFDRLITLDKAIARTFAPGQEAAAVVALGRFSARLNFGSGLDLSRGVNVHSHFWGGNTHHAKFQDFGTCTYVPLEVQAFRMEYREYPVLSRVFCGSAHGYFEASIELLGGVEPIVEESACQCYGDDSCTFVVSWERSGGY